MPVHIFTINEENYDICLEKGVAAIPTHDKDNVKDGLLSRMSIINKGDYILFYVIGVKEIRGVFKVKEKPFFDMTSIWPDNGQIYPFRVRFEYSEYNFSESISLSDIYDLKDSGLIWTFTLNRPSGSSNALFSITNLEFEEILKLFLKVNPFYTRQGQIHTPYTYFKPGFSGKLTFDDSGVPKYETTLMNLLLESFVDGRFHEIFGAYSDYISYVPTSFNKEIDILLLHSSPLDAKDIIAYDIIEVKNGLFNDAGLKQLLMYEDWFLKKRVNGDFNRIRTSAIASRFSVSVKEYLSKRKKYEGKSVLLYKFEYSNSVLNLTPENY